ncbi:hypothetical protein APR12_003833 [Nocardia amikacinitolerans]|uniref:hypothetical protein n=1 Tax=Nocardia amikacinitolerans TaxID=756689 RepID=UPI000A59CBC9|nr:hypothetical protein [Nocardia amikacinitolerans]MCP2318478.1 hypothetical protein [Nocardia amikacinitolerans]
MSSRSAHPLAYPIGVTLGALAVCAAWAPFATVDQLAGLATVALGISGYTGIRLLMAFGVLSCGLPGAGGFRVARVRQQHRLVSRSWLEVIGPAGARRWLPVFFDPALVTFTESAAEFDGRVLRAGDLRLYPSGRARDTEPPGRLVDNPSRPDPDAPVLAASRVTRRLLFDVQPAVAAPFAALLWIYVDGGGLVTFVGALCVAAATATWLAAIRGSDPS